MMITDAGPQRIDSMLLGKDVLARDEVTGTVALRMVTKQHVADYQDRYLVTVRDIETGKDQTLTASWSHPFFARMPENTPMAVGAEGLVYQGAIEWAAWVDAKDLKAGYELLNPDDTWAEVVEVQRVATPLTAYNLTVEEFSTFFVAANMDAEPVWVHNACKISGIDPRDLTRTHSIEGDASSRRVNALADGMRQDGFDPAQPIDVVDVDGRMHIIDGHHRAAAATRVGETVTVNVVEPADLPSHRSNFSTVQDVVNSAAEAGPNRLRLPRGGK